MRQAIALLAVACLSAIVRAQDACNMKDPDYKFDSSAPKWEADKGYEVFMQIPVHADITKNFGNNFNGITTETFFIRSFADADSRGAAYIAFKHKMISLAYDKVANESILIDYQYGSCDVQRMIQDTEFSAGYFHGNEKPIYVPFPELLADLTRFKIKKLTTWDSYRGFANVARYETCYDARPLALRILRELGGVNIPPGLLDLIPNPAPARIRWLLADPSWEMEDGRLTDTIVPLGIEITFGLSVPIVLPKAMLNATITFGNFHGHYPKIDEFTEDLMQPPPGVHCRHRYYRDGEYREMPVLPRKFHVKTESVVVEDGKNVVFDSSDYYDYDKQLFRFDVRLQRPNVQGSVVWELLHDYANNISYTVDRTERTCKKHDLNEQKADLQFDDKPITHLLMRPYDLLQLHDIGHTYVGKKPCRGMSCHFWSGTKPLGIKTKDGRETYGVFGIWATRKSWSANFSSETDVQDAPYYIVKVETIIYARHSNREFVGRTNLEIYDYLELDAKHDIFFYAPNEAFCGAENDPTAQPELPERYQFRGEYNYDEWNTSFPIFLNYDAEWNVIRFDWRPPMTDLDNYGYRQSIVFDVRSNTMYKIDRVTNVCVASQIPAGYAGEDIDPLRLIWPPTMHTNIKEGLFKYIGVGPCRSMACDNFEMVRSEIDNEKRTFDYQFLSARFMEIDPNFPLAEISHALARVSENYWKGIVPEPMKRKSIDIFEYTNLRSVYWEYEVAAPCFAGVNAWWLRITFKADDPEGMQYVNNDILRTELLEQLRKNASNITPLRISNLVVVQHLSDNTFSAEFKIRDHHPSEQFFGPSLHDAVRSLEHGIKSGEFTVQIIIPDPETGRVKSYSYSPIPESFEVCREHPCSVPDQLMPIIELDTGALAGTIIGSIIAGLLVTAIILSIVISRKHGVPVPALYIGDVPGSNMSQELVHRNDKSPSDD